MLFAIFLSIPGHSQLDERQMDEFLVALQDSAAIPGLSFAVLSEGRIKYLFSNGLLSKEGEARVNNKTIFEAASLTKPVAALCAMKLVEEGVEPERLYNLAGGIMRWREKIDQSMPKY